MGNKKANAKQKQSTANGSEVSEARASSRSKASRKGAKTQNETSGNQQQKQAPKSTNELSPILGELDLHLFGEGKHERIYEKLGAHLTTHEGKRGVAFAVWAPNAKNVSVEEFRTRVIVSSAIARWPLSTPSMPWKMDSRMSSFCRLRNIRMVLHGAIRSVLITRHRLAMARLMIFASWLTICINTDWV